MNYNAPQVLSMSLVFLNARGAGRDGIERALVHLLFYIAINPKPQGLLC